MFTFCFTTIAAANLRHTPKSARLSSVVRLVRRGLVSLAVVLATAGVTYAGNKNGNSQFKAMKSTPKTLTVDNAKRFSLAAPKYATGDHGAPMNRKLVLSDASKSIGQSFTANSGINRKLVLSDSSRKISEAVVAKSAVNTKLIMSDPSRKIAEALKGGKGKGGGKDDDCHNDKHDDKCHKSFDWCWTFYHGNGCYKPYRYWNDCNYRCEGVDLELMTLRLMDAGNPALNLGPAFRVWIRNNSNVAISRPFNVLLVAAKDAPPTPDLPQAGVRVGFIQPGQIIAVDIRLPVQANLPGLPVLQVLVDSHREVFELYEDNNIAILPRTSIQPFDPAALAAQAQPVSGVAGLATSMPAAVTVEAQMPAVD